MTTKVSHCSRAETHRPKDSARRLNNGGTLLYIPCFQQVAPVVESAGLRSLFAKVKKVISFLNLTGRGICIRPYEASVAFPTMDILLSSHPSHITSIFNGTLRQRLSPKNAPAAGYHD